METLADDSANAGGCGAFFLASAAIRGALSVRPRPGSSRHINTTLDRTPERLRRRGLSPARFRSQVSGPWAQFGANIGVGHGPGRVGLGQAPDPDETPLISISHRFLFIHVPKTGVNSIQNILKAYSDDAVVCVAPHHDGVERFEVRSGKYKTVKHSTLADYRREYGDELLSRLFTFCCVRNPWDRCISHFFSPHRGQVEWSKAAFLRFLETEIKPFAWYVTIPGQPDSLPRNLGNIDFVMRFESLQADFDQACQRLSLPPMVLPRRNASSRDAYQLYYDAETADAVAAKFSDEIQYFGYSLS